jgi:RNA polymerase sigma factor (sigma-70 family)
MQPPDRLAWLAEIYRTYATDLQRYIYSKVGEPFLAEDLTSTVFLKALRWLRHDQSGESVRGWLYATARTTIADYWQAQGQYELHSLARLEDQSCPEQTRSEAARQRAEIRVQRLLDMLPAREREILKMRYFQSYSAAEIAQVLGTSAGHIRVLQLRALKRAAQLEKQERNIYIMPESASPFDQFAQFLTPESRHVLDLAREEAIKLKHWFVGTEHILWGLANESSLASFWAPLGITPERIHGGIVFIYDRHLQQNQPSDQEAPSPDTMPDARNLLTPRAKQVIIIAGTEAKKQGEKSIRPTHLLFGLMNEGGGIGAGLMRALGISPLQVQAALASPDPTQTCSFCGRSGSHVKRIFLAKPVADAPLPSSSICNECVEKFHTMLQQS